MNPTNADDNAIKFNLHIVDACPELNDAWSALLISIENIELNTPAVLHALVRFLRAIEDAYPDINYIEQLYKDQIIKHLSEKKRAKVTNILQLEKLFALQNAIYRLPQHCLAHYKTNTFLKNIYNICNSPQFLTQGIHNHLNSLPIPFSTVIIEGLDPTNLAIHEKDNWKRLLLDLDLLFIEKGKIAPFNSHHDLSKSSITLYQLIKENVDASKEVVDISKKIINISKEIIDVSHETIKKHETLQKIDDATEDFDSVFKFIINQYSKSVYQFMIDNPFDFNEKEFFSLTKNQNWGIIDPNFSVTKNLLFLQKFNSLLDNNELLKAKLQAKGFFVIDTSKLSSNTLSDQNQKTNIRSLFTKYNLQPNFKNKDSVLNQIANCLSANCAWQRLISAISQIKFNHVDYLFCAENFLAEIQKKFTFASKISKMVFDDNDYRNVITMFADASRVKLTKEDLEKLICINNAVIHKDFSGFEYTLFKDLLRVLEGITTPYLPQCETQKAFEEMKAESEIEFNKIKSSTKEDNITFDNWLNIKTCSTKFHSETELTNFGIKLIRDICCYFVRHDIYENAFHNQHLAAEKIIRGIKQQLLNRNSTTPVAKRFAKIVLLLQEFDIGKGFLHDIIHNRLKEIEEFLPYVTPRKTAAYQALCSGFDTKDSRSDQEIEAMIEKTPWPIIAEQRIKYRENLIKHQLINQNKSFDALTEIEKNQIEEKCIQQESRYKRFLRWFQNAILFNNSLVKTIRKTGLYAWKGEFDVPQHTLDAKTVAENQLKAPRRLLS